MHWPFVRDVGGDGEVEGVVGVEGRIFEDGGGGERGDGGYHFGLRIGNVEETEERVSEWVRHSTDVGVVLPWNGLDARGQDSRSRLRVL